MAALPQQTKQKQRRLAKWFRMYPAILDSPKIQKLPADRFKDWLNLMCLASESGKVLLLPSNEEIASRLHLPEVDVAVMLAFMFDSELIEVIQRRGMFFYKMHDVAELV